MHHLISLIGLKFYLFELQGTLTYEYTKNAKPPVQYHISDQDLEDLSDSDDGDTEGAQLLRSGVNASAVGIELRLIKNDGLLRMKFEGRDGTTAEWVFEGLQVMGKGGIVASVGTQTYIDPDKCMTCGHKKVTPAKMQDRGSQMETATTMEFGTQTDVVYTAEITFTAEAGVQSSVEQHPPISIKEQKTDG